MPTGWSASLWMRTPGRTPTIGEISEIVRTDYTIRTLLEAHIRITIACGSVVPSENDPMYVSAGVIPVTTGG